MFIAVAMFEEVPDPPEREEALVDGTGAPEVRDLLSRSDLCHLHEGRAEAEACALDEKLQGEDRDVVLVARSGSSRHVWTVRRSLSEVISGRLLPRV